MNNIEEDWKVREEVKEIIKRNKLPDQNGTPHPNAGIFIQIENELNRLSILAQLPLGDKLIQVIREEASSLNNQIYGREKALKEDMSMGIDTATQLGLLSEARIKYKLILKILQAAQRNK